MQTEKWTVRGMTCAACVARVEKVLVALPGVKKVEVNLLLDTAYVEFDDHAVQREAIGAAITSSGYDADWLGTGVAPQFKAKRNISFTVKQSDSIREQHDRRQKHQKAEMATHQKIALFCVVLSLPFFISMPAMLSGDSDTFHFPWLQFVFATLIQVFGGARFYRNAWFAVKSKLANMDVLIVLGSSSAYLYSVWMLVTGNPHNVYFEASALIITFVLFGKWLELRARRQTTSAIEGLLLLHPGRAHVIRDGQEVEMLPGDVNVGERILVRAGEQIALDGEITEGEGSVDESMLTGESMPLQKSAGMSVFAGTINTSGTFTMRVTKTEGQTLLSQMVSAVERAQASKAPVQQLADRIAAHFAIIMIIVATMSALVWLIWIEPFDVGRAVMIFTSVLVVACPCALGLATPAALIAGMGRSAEHGILFRDGESLQHLSAVQRVAFDKTGTLTEGKPVLVDFIVMYAEAPVDADHTNWDESRLLQLAASLETFSEHPLARAVVASAKEKGLSLQRPQQFSTNSGHELSGQIDGMKVAIYSLRTIAARSITFSIAQTQNISALTEKGYTVSVMMVNDQPAAMMAFADRARPDVAEMLNRLQSMGCTLCIVTGDNERTAQQWLAHLGSRGTIDLNLPIELYAGLLPLEKQSLIEQWKGTSKLGKVLMVGDGINDAPALASADLGMAVSGGTDIARFASGVVLTREHLLLIPRAMELARKTMLVVKQNLFWAFAFNTLMIPLAVSGMLSPHWAGAAMASSSLIVMFNALRLKRI